MFTLEDLKEYEHAQKRVSNLCGPFVLLSIPSEIMELARALGCTHNRRESLYNQRQELMDVMMFTLELLRAESNPKGFHIAKNYEIDLSKLLGAKDSEVIEIMLCSYKSAIHMLSLVSLMAKRLGMDKGDFKKHFYIKIEQNLKRFGGI